MVNRLNPGHPISESRSNTAHLIPVSGKSEVFIKHYLFSQHKRRNISEGPNQQKVFFVLLPQIHIF